MAFPADPVSGEEGEVTCSASAQVQEQCQSLGRLERVFGPVRHERDPLMRKGRRNIACIRFLGFRKSRVLIDIDRIPLLRIPGPGLRPQTRKSQTGRLKPRREPCKTQRGGQHRRLRVQAWEPRNGRRLRSNSESAYEHAASPVKGFVH